METRKVSNEQLRECMNAFLNNEVINTASCLRLAGEYIDVVNVADLCIDKSAMITLKQAELITGIRKAFKFICDEIDFNDCSQLIITLSKMLGVRLDGHYGDLIVGDGAYARWKSCNDKHKTPMERAVAWFASIVYYEPFESMNEVIAFIMYNKVLIENGVGCAAMSVLEMGELKTAVNKFRSEEFTEYPEQIACILNSMTNQIKTEN